VAVVAALVVVASTVLAAPGEAAAVEYFAAPPPLAELDVPAPAPEEPAATAAAEAEPAATAAAEAEPRRQTGAMQAYAWPAGAGDTLRSVAEAFGVTDLELLRLVNPGLDDDDVIPEGTTVHVPVEAASNVPRLPGAEQSTAPRHGDPATEWTVWDDLAQCESSGNWHIDTGNGYYGGLQFALSSWQWVGGTGYPHEHDRLTQIQMAERLLSLQGWEAWPACSKKLGLR
jgi:hypothetical protein